MRQPTPNYYWLAAQMLARDAQEHAESAELADAAERICQKLHGQLVVSIGQEGFRVLMARALRMATEEFPFFQRVEVVSGSETCLKDLHESAEGVEPEEVSRAVVALLANFIWLLATFISEKLVLRQMIRIWPGVSFGSTGEDSQEVKQ